MDVNPLPWSCVVGWESPGVLPPGTTGETGGRVGSSCRSDVGAQV